MKIVIVDDDKSLRSLLSSLCISEGYQVVAEFGDGVGLIDFVSTQQPDVVCLDFNLPGANGLELLVEMDVVANAVDVIMISGSDEPELKGHAADLGATGFIRKPFEQAQIIAELKDIEATRRIAAQAAKTPLPAAPTTPPPTASVIEGEKSVPPPAEPPARVIPRTAVIVDDSGSVRLLLKGVLEACGIKVLGVATNGRDGVELARKIRPALLCLDVDMPGMSGIEALPLVREASPETTVIMITGNASRNIVQAAVAGGARGYFLKPIRPAKIEEFIRKLIQI